MRFTALLALLALTAGTTALAQPATQSAPAAGAAAPSADLPKHNCTKPGPFPGETTSTDRQLMEYGKEYKVYTDCLRKFALDQQKMAEPHMKAANAAADEYNAAVKVYNDEMERRKEK
jgi:hypothetical protein